MRPRWNTPRGRWSLWMSEDTGQTADSDVTPEACFPFSHVDCYIDYVDCYIDYIELTGSAWLQNSSAHKIPDDPVNHLLHGRSIVCEDWRLGGRVRRPHRRSDTLDEGKKRLRQVLG